MLHRHNSDSHQPESSLHVVMNLPSLAIDFLRYFRGLFRGSELPAEPCASLQPVIHCYTFSRAEDPTADAADRAAAALGVAAFEELQDCAVRVVRNVAPSKEMLCVTLRLPWHILGADDASMSPFLWSPQWLKCFIVGGEVN